MTRKLTLLMLSRMGAGDGGRETWLANFLDEIVRQERKFEVDVIHLHSDDATLLDTKLRRTLVTSARKIPRRWRWCPTSIEFLFRLSFSRFKRPPGTPILAVGGLAEAVGALLVAPLCGRHARIMWLRSIYTREKSAQLPGRLKTLAVAFERRVLAQFGTVIANGADTAAFYQSLGIESHVIPNAVPLRKWAMPPPPSTGTLRVAFIGRLAEVKGIHPFLQAVEYCDLDAPGRCLFHVAGDGPARSAVEAMSSRVALAYHGQVDNDAARDIVSDSDVCVALTISSPDLGGGGVSNALIEQMAAGRILVAWDNDIFRQVLDPAAAYLVPQGDARALADVLLHVTMNRDEALGRASRARQLAATYSISGHVDRFFSLLEERIVWKE